MVPIPFFDQVFNFLGTLQMKLALPQKSDSEGLIAYRTHLAVRVVIMYQVPGMMTEPKVRLMQEQLLKLAPQLLAEFPEAHVVLELQGWNTIPAITIER